MPFRLAVYSTVAAVALTFLFLASFSHHRPHPTSHPRRRSTTQHNEPRQVTVTTEITTKTTVRTRFTTSTKDARPSTRTEDFPFSSPPSSSDPASLPSTFIRSISSTSSPLTTESSTVSFSTSFSLQASSTTAASPRVSSSVQSTSRTNEDTLVLVPTTLALASEPPPLPTDSILPTTSVTAVVPPPPPPTTSDTTERATSSGDNKFWNNKAAVGGTFTVVALVFVGVISVLVATCIKRSKKRQIRRRDEETFRCLFEPDHGSDHDNLNEPPSDPFAAGEVIQRQGSGVSLPIMGGAAARTAYTHSPDGSGSDQSQSSLNHHGFSSISYRTGIPGSDLPAHQESLLSSQLPSLPTSKLPYLYSNSSAAMPPPSSHHGQDYNTRQADSDASYYADQIHSYYYGPGATAPPGRPSDHEV